MNTRQQEKNLAELNRELMEVRFALRQAADRLEVIEELASECGLSTTAALRIKTTAVAARDKTLATDEPLRLLSNVRGNRYETWPPTSDRGDR